MSQATFMDDRSANEKAVLVVDDHEIVRDLIVTILKNAGLRVFQADSGAVALQTMRVHGAKIGCVLQDLSMPEMPGEEVIAAMLRLDSQLPIIAMSVYDEAHARAKLRNMNLAGYVQKPFEAEFLTSTVRDVLAGKMHGA